MKPQKDPLGDALPILELEAGIVEALGACPRLVVKAPTGSGKSTLLPQILVDREIARGQVAVLEPRRLAARMLAGWVARRRGVRLGGEVGYQVRLENVCSRDTRIRYVTEGVLLRQMLRRPDLDGIGVLVFDEFHERRLDSDIALAKAIELQETRRPDLKIVVMSATLEDARLVPYLDPCRVLESDGRCHPVEVRYLKGGAAAASPAPVWELAARACRGLVAGDGHSGDVLVFMPGAHEIHRTRRLLEEDSKLRGCRVLPLYSALSKEAQDAVMERSDRRRIIVATNIAETSLTIDGVRMVIDGGLARVARHDPRRGINTLLVEKISRASAEQRAGRAGRTAPGVCLRLWSEAEHARRPERERPEVARVDLSEAVLALKASGVGDLEGFRWLEPPPDASLRRAIELLGDLGALDAGSESITAIGRAMIAYPLHPRYARMLVEAERSDCVETVALIAALAQGRGLFVRKPGRDIETRRDDLFGGNDGSDFYPQIEAWRYAVEHKFDPRRCGEAGIHGAAAREAHGLLRQFLGMAGGRGGFAGGGRDAASTYEFQDIAVRKAILAGFADHLAARRDAGTVACDVVHGRRGKLAPDSCLREARLFVAAEVEEVERRKGEVDVLLRLATAVDEDWLRELFPDGFSESEEVAFDPRMRRVVCRKVRKFRDLVLEEKAGGEAPDSPAAEILAREVLAGNLVLKKWDGAVEQWIERLNCLAGWMPELDLPAVNEADRLAILEQVCFGARSYRDIKDLPVRPVLARWLSAPQSEALEAYAPERIGLPNGKTAKVRYKAGSAPVVSILIANLFGIRKNPAVAGGKVPVLVEILAPNHRPLQLTGDLPSFWREVYPKARQELQRRYPKHRWE